MASQVNASSFTEIQLVTFHLGHEEFGANIMNVKEIVRVTDITKVPNAPSYIEGVCNLRGSVLPIIDGRSRLSMEKKEKDENSRVLVIDINGKATGMIVDKVSEVMRVNTSEVEPPPAVIKNIDTDYISGVVKLNSGKRLIMFLELLKILNMDDMEGLNEIIDNMSNNSGTAESIATSTKEMLEEEQLVSFMIGKEEYALNIMQVKEIIRVPEIVKVPNCEHYIEGVVSIRNHLLPILNLRRYFGMEDDDLTDHTRILIVDMGNMTSGILVDKVTEVIRVPTSVIQPPPPVFYNADGEQIKGIAKLNNGKRLLLLLEPTKLLSMDELSNIKSYQESSSEEETKSIERQLMDEEQLVTFKLDNEEFAIKITDVQEINRMTEITKIPRAPYFIEGIVNLRGNIIPALDLRKLFGLSDQEKTDSTRVIIVDVESKKTGIVVDAVSEVLRFEKSYIEAPPKILSSGIDTEYIEGVGKLDSGKRMILILSLRKVLKFNEKPSIEVEPEKKVETAKGKAKKQPV
ncbi:chemotaxis protein CheW [Pseudobacteroides cellulosolvens]|uniref:CheW protein n=1 Tax=Pseudobacteroides cellulosolvens ATCC 35603 = DSM 2933 TaxID=398512 RepID=A0A0L6JKR1_9FIRM|nr:chemotaxis protein CheW [Pseudobacteroides cellulosolvens]KNY26298.1 CheW protein [Pseudobacteroides cellulosolvens ATCC 35603 = DSM 2933]